MENQSPEQFESVWRRKLSAAERARLRNQPGLEAEAQLTDALTRLPDSPVPSNFTARVMDAIEREDVRVAREERPRGWHWNWRGWLPRAAMAVAVLLVAGLGVQRYELSAHRAAIAKTLSQVASAKSVPDLEALNNFDAIVRMGQSAHADTDLLVALQ